MSLPNLLIVGAAKSGTTSLHNYLNQHPDIFMSNPKEPHFLINTDIGVSRIPKGIIDKKEYENLFSSAQSFKYRGESSVMYLSFPEIAIKNIKHYLGDNIKIIIMLRNPVDRAYSGYQHIKRYNMMKVLDFDEELKISEIRYNNNNNITPASRHLMLGKYYNQVKLYKKAFKHVHVVIYDDYKSRFDNELDKIFKFLSIDSIPVDATTRHMQGGWEWRNNYIKKIALNKNWVKSCFKYIIPSLELRRYIWRFFQKNKIQPLSLKTKAWLKLYYKDDVKKLSELLNRNLNHWTL